MTDVFDRAQEADLFRRELAVSAFKDNLAERAFRAGVRQLAKPSAFLLCDDCGDPIDAERRKAVPACKRCVDCQEAAERRLRTHRGA